MKRTPLKRSRKPMTRSTTLNKRTTPLRTRLPGKKSEPGSTAYLKFVRSQPCTVCEGSKGLTSEAAHTNVQGQSGMGVKTGHLTTIPLCGYCHRLDSDSYHTLTPESAWAAHHGLNLDRLTARLQDLYARIRGKAA